MNKVMLTAYSIPTDYSSRGATGIPTDHVFVASADGHCWNCLGDSHAISDSKQIAQELVYAEWADFVQMEQTIPALQTM